MWELVTIIFILVAGDVMHDYLKQRKKKNKNVGTM